MKPITAEKVKRELDNLRRPVPEEKRIQVQCFGNFEVYLDGIPLEFKYHKTKDLLDTLETAGCADVITQQRGKLGLVPEAIRCDYYDWCDGKRMGNAYLGEYMAQYGWSEYTNAALQQIT